MSTSRCCLQTSGLIIDVLDELWPVLGHVLCVQTPLGGHSLLEYAHSQSVKRRARSFRCGLHDMSDELFFSPDDWCHFESVLEWRLGLDEKVARRSVASSATDHGQWLMMRLMWPGLSCAWVLLHRWPRRALSCCHRRDTWTSRR